MLVWQVTRRSSDKWLLFSLVLIIALSAYTHMWNPVGFLIFHGDESIYIERGVGILNGEVRYGLYDHPFFGQIVLAGFMSVAGYQNLVDDPSTEQSHLEALYAYPRTFMGLLAVLDTLLVYLIADRMFGRRVAAVSAVIFAVAPMSLLLRMVLLDSILIPFLLSSILLALHSRGSGRRHLFLLASGACLGLAIFTKVPAAAMILPCAILAYSAFRRIRDVGLWLAPVLAIPVIWPVSAAWVGQFDMWAQDVIWQTGRSNGGLPGAMKWLFEHDPILISLGMAGFVFVGICLFLRLGRGYGGVKTEGDKRGGMSHDPHTASPEAPGGFTHMSRYWKLNTMELRSLGFLTVWFSSILVSFGALGFVAFYHLSMLLPALCIAASVLILRGGGWLTHGTGGQMGYRTVLLAVMTIGIVGLFTTGVIVSFDVQSSEFEAASFLLQNHFDEHDTVKVVSMMFYWPFSDVYNLQNTTRLYNNNNPIYSLQDVTEPAIRNQINMSYNYVPPDAERVILVLGGHDKKFIKDTVKDCDYTVDDTSRLCRKAYNIMRLYNDGNLIREFENGVPIGEFLPLPPDIEQYLKNPSVIVEWGPTK